MLDEAVYREGCSGVIGKKGENGPIVAVGVGVLDPPICCALAHIGTCEARARTTPQP